MASCTTPLWGTTSTCPRLIFTVTESSSTDTTSTLSWTLQYYAGASGATTSNKKSYSAVIAGQTVSSGSYSINKKTGYHTIASGTKTINKGTSTQTVSFSCSMGFNLSWSGTYGGTKSASGSIAISAKTKYTISYNANGGSGAPGSQIKWAGTNVTISSTKPTRTGHTFAGWATSTSGTVAYQPGSTYSANASVTLYAKWTAFTYTVSYNANGGFGAPGNQTKIYGQTLTLSKTTPTRTNYIFKGWGNSSSSITAVYQPGGAFDDNVSITLYAIWELNYIKPRITNLSADRCNSSGNLIEDGTYAIIKFNWNADKPISSILIQYKNVKDSSWTTVSVSNTNGTVREIIGGSLGIEETYDVKVIVRDSVGESSDYSTIAPISFEIDLLYGGGGVAFGKPAIRKGFEVAMDARFDKSLSVKGRNILDEIDLLKSKSMSEHFNKSLSFTERDVLNEIDLLNNILFYKSGDSITITGWTGGFFTISGTGLHFSVPVGKSLDQVNSATISSARLTVRQNGTYCVGSASGHETLNLDMVSPSVVLSKDNGNLNIQFVFSESRAALNNDACGIDYEISITFS